MTVCAPTEAVAGGPVAPAPTGAIAVRNGNSNSQNNNSKNNQAGGPRGGNSSVANAADNPFKLPPEMEFFWLQSADHHKSDADKRRKDLHIWDKPTAASRYSGTQTLKDEDLPMAPIPPKLQKRLEEMKGRVLEVEQPSDTFLTTIATKPSVGVVEPLRKEERDLRNYVQKKRDMFLVQMALDVKKSEIGRLEEKARMKEEALAKSQRTLDEDAKKFDELFEDRYSRAQLATKKADNYAKRKLDKIQKIKSTRALIAALQSEIGKLREVREECARYKQFLVKLTPPEWKDQQQEIKLARREKRRQDFINATLDPILAKLADEERLLEKPAGEEPRQRTRPGKAGRAQEEELAQKERERRAKGKKLQIRREEEERRVTNSYVEVDSEEEPELFFKEPKQLMNTFTELEEKNLFLIQSSQETEQMLDELQQKFEHNRNEMSAKVQRLHENIRNLQANIAQEQRHCDQLKRSLEEKAGTELQDQKLEDLGEQVHEVYAMCGLKVDHDPDMLQMLGAIESKLEELIHGLDVAFQQDKELVIRLEKEKNRERRDRVKELWQQEVVFDREKRLRDSLQRSQKPVYKKAGKQVMFRSPPLRVERKVVKDSSDDEKNAADYRIFGMYIDRKTQRPQTEPPTAAEETRQQSRVANIVSGESAVDATGTTSGYGGGGGGAVDGIEAGGSTTPADKRGAQAVATSTTIG